MAKKDTVIEIEGKQLKLSNLDKVLYPAVGFTKGQVIDYIVRIAPVLLPHLNGRPLTLKRYPEGVDGMFFYEKSCPKHRPDWVQTAPIWSHGRNDYIQFCLAQDIPTLVWAANLADLELHTSLSLAKKIEEPTMMVFDLDPGPPADIVLCCQVAFWLRDIFDRFNLKAFPKTSGSKGLQIYVPLNTPVTYDETKGFSHALARLLEEEHPDLVVSEMKKTLRTGKIFVDWSQNDEHKTTVNVYSLRAKERPTVSTPVAWEEVEKCLKKKDANLLVFDSAQVLARVAKMGDIFEPVLTLKQRLPNVAELGGRTESAGATRANSPAEPKSKTGHKKKSARSTVKAEKRAV
ncbi:MAG TPA: non-homologous end-joining DNA ligase [Terriglobales bacterium]|nr:non-homologous end-joining DNA ligase [Terriglobales bacterium]